MRMKLFFVLFLNVLPSVASAALWTDPPTLQFGVVKPETEKVQKVKITNNGDKPIKLLEASVECQHCTKVKFEPTVLEPGKSVEVPVTFHPPSFESGAIHRSVYITTDDPSQQKLDIKLTAFVTDTMALLPSELRLDGPRTSGQKIERELEVANVSGKPIKVLYAITPLDGPKLVVPKKPVGPGETAKIQLTWDLPSKEGQYEGQVTLYIDHPKTDKLSLPYSATVSAGAKGNADQKQDERKQREDEDHDDTAKPAGAQIPPAEAPGGGCRGADRMGRHRATVIGANIGPNFRAAIRERIAGAVSGLIGYCLMTAYEQNSGQAAVTSCLHRAIEQQRTYLAGYEKPCEPIAYEVLRTLDDVFCREVMEPWRSDENERRVRFVVTIYRPRIILPGARFG